MNNTINSPAVSVIITTKNEEIDETAGKTIYLFDRLIGSLNKKRTQNDMATKAYKANKAIK